ncbi:hypothetical protein OPV22_024464 [Ensete ventricosum]|uniref:Uncharacterized protein n=1 Tax=Ensete ventricosum TaxID=4639 RepID=A0AAV8Q4T1_ENSVE|nr:hypothetical protein OPV22_024464 [Ensete ventricosum]
MVQLHQRQGLDCQLQHICFFNTLYPVLFPENFILQMRWQTVADRPEDYLKLVQLDDVAREQFVKSIIFYYFSRYKL